MALDGLACHLMADHFIEEADHEPDVTKWRIRWVETIPYILLHVACVAVFWVGFSWAALALCVGMYVIRMFAITGFYHRYFSHKTFSASRPVQFLMGLLGTSAVQRGPIWWAATIVITILIPTRIWTLTPPSSTDFGSLTAGGSCARKLPRFEFVW